MTLISLFTWIKIYHSHRIVCKLSRRNKWRHNVTNRIIEGFFTKEEETISTNSSTFPLKGSYPWYYESFVLGISERGPDVLYVRRTVILEMKNGNHGKITIQRSRISAIFSGLFFSEIPAILSNYSEKLKRKWWTGLYEIFST